MPDRSEWPHAHAGPRWRVRRWSGGGRQSSLAPQLIAVFLWIAYFDQIPQETLGPAGILWSALGAALAGLLAYLLLYRPPAHWGLSTRRPLGVIAASTFGVRSDLGAGPLAERPTSVVWLAVRSSTRRALSLRGLVLLQLLDPRYLLTYRIAAGRGPGCSVPGDVSALVLRGGVRRPVSRPGDRRPDEHLPGRAGAPCWA